jgi:MSHA biogenesis protein MshK
MFRRLILISLCTGWLAIPAVADGLRDPMRPVGAAPAAPRALSVQALKLEGVIGGEPRVAIINGKLVRAGDSIAGVRIVEVLENGVRFERGGRISTLTLPAPSPTTAVRVARSQDKNP